MGTLQSRAENSYQRIMFGRNDNHGITFGKVLEKRNVGMLGLEIVDDEWLNVYGTK